MASILRVLFAIPALALIAPRPLLGQEPCPDRGSQRIPTTWSRGSALPCSPLGDPSWWLRTPSHRRVVAKTGATLGAAHLHPALILRYRCTGFATMPIELYEVRAWGAVTDVEEFSCAGPLPPPAPPGTER